MSRSSGLLARRLALSAPVFSALGDETRLRLVARLSTHGPQTITQLAEVAEVSRQAITKHLRVLEEGGLVRSEKRGRERHFAICGDRLQDARRQLDLISERWDGAIERLRALVED